MQPKCIAVGDAPSRQVACPWGAGRLLRRWRQEHTVELAPALCVHAHALLGSRSHTSPHHSPGTRSTTALWLLQCLLCDQPPSLAAGADATRSPITIAHIAFVIGASKTTWAKRRRTPACDGGQAGAVRGYVWVWLDEEPSRVKAIADTKQVRSELPLFFFRVGRSRTHRSMDPTWMNPRSRAGSRATTKKALHRTSTETSFTLTFVRRVRSAELERRSVRRHGAAGVAAPRRPPQPDLAQLAQPAARHPVPGRRIVTRPGAHDAAVHLLPPATACARATEAASSPCPCQSWGNMVHVHLYPSTASPHEPGAADAAPHVPRMVRVADRGR